MFQSSVTPLGVVAFPDYSGERVYMVPFAKDKALPDNLARWQGTVDAMMADVDTDQECFLMIDQSPVVAGNTHRRAGWHVDGYWVPAIGGHGHRAVSCHGGGGAHSSIPRPTGGHRVSGHGGSIIEESGHRGTHGFGASSWAKPDFSIPELILLATDISACRAAVGEYSGLIKDGGDCSEIDVSGMDIVALEANRAYAGNVSFLHESTPVAFDCNRTVVRINVPRGVIAH